MLKRIRPDQVIPGMYIAKFGGSWLHHPFWRAGFVVRSDKQLARIHGSEADLFIDTSLGVDLPEEPASGAAPGSAPTPMSMSMSMSRLRASPPPAPMRPPAPALPTRAPKRVVAPAAFGKADKARAVALAQRSTKVVKALFDDCRVARSVPPTQILAVVDDIAGTLEQSSGAFTSITRLKTKDDETYTHSIAVCALMIGLAREANATPATVQALGTAGLLHDLGKVLVDDAILLKTLPLTEAEIATIRQHPELGHGILSEERELPATVLDVCMHHHERLDGSGYPFGLSGDGISQATRMVAICDVYDAMTSTRPYKKGMSPADAIARMEEESALFDPDLLFKFMRSIGVFPAGKLVRLRSNRLGVVLPAAGEDRCTLVRAFYATVDTCFIPYEDAVISDRLSDDQAVRAEDPANWFTCDWPAMRAGILAGTAPQPAIAGSGGATAQAA